MDETRIEIERERRKVLRDRNTAQLVVLLGRRDELRGVTPMADYVADNVSWCA